MKTILRNFLNVVRRFKVATVLNLLGLTVAFAAFILIMMQVDYDYNYNKQIPGQENIFRFEMMFDGKGQSIVSRPLGEMFFESSPHIEAGVLLNLFWGKSVLEIEKNGMKELFEERIIPVTERLGDVFEFDMLQGVAASVGEPDKVLLPESIAKRMFPGEIVLDKVILLNGRNYIVGGVYRDFPLNSSLKNGIYYSMQQENKENWGNSSYVAFVRLSSPAVEQDVTNNFIEKYTNMFAASGWDNTRSSFRLIPFSEMHYIRNVEYDPEEKGSRQTLAVMTGIAVVLLIIAGINFTNFSMALTPVRIKSLNTQKVMGAETAMLRIAILSEAFCICILSFGIALLLVYIFTSTDLRDLVSGDATLAAHTGIVLVTGGLALLLALLAGLYPAYYMTSFSPALVLKGSFGLSPKGRNLRNGLLGFQFVASFALIIGAGFMYLQNHFMQNEPLGYNKDEVIVCGVNWTVMQKRDAFVNELKQFAGIEDVTGAQFLLSSGERYMGWGRNYRDGTISFQCLPVDPSFLQVMGIEVPEGRDFRNEDENTPTGAYIFNEKARNEFEMELGDRVDGVEIIGFIPDIKFASFRTEVLPMAFYVWGKEGWGSPQNNIWTYIKVSAGADLKAAYKHVQNTLQNFDPGYPFKVMFFDQVLQNTYEKERKMTLLITLFSLVAIFISIVGVFGLVIFESQYRIKEIGVRKVMGSTTGQIILMFNRLYLRILIICFILAVPISFWVIRDWLENFAYRTPMYWWMFLISFIVVTIITLLTVTFQNWRAANSNPVDSIKTE